MELPGPVLVAVLAVAVDEGEEARVVGNLRRAERADVSNLNPDLLARHHDKHPDGLCDDRLHDAGPERHLPAGNAVHAGELLGVLCGQLHPAGKHVERAGFPGRHRDVAAHPAVLVEVGKDANRLAPAVPDVERQSQAVVDVRVRERENCRRPAPLHGERDVETIALGDRNGRRAVARDLDRPEGGALGPDVDPRGASLIRAVSLATEASGEQENRGKREQRRGNLFHLVGVAPAGIQASRIGGGVRRSKPARLATRSLRGSGGQEGRDWLVEPA